MIYHFIFKNSNLNFKWRIDFEIKEIDHNLVNIGDIIVHFYPFTIGKQITIRINQHVNFQQFFYKKINFLSLCSFIYFTGK